MGRAMTLNNKIIPVAYLRYSYEDFKGTGYTSIENQRQIILEYIASQGWELFDIYIDDGYSGTNFERPGFLKLLNDIKPYRINCIVVKDLSRLGRNYIETGKYFETIFPKLGVRCIALGDNYDSIHDEENDIMPFKNILNEMYAKDISRKIRSSRRINAKQGLFMGSVAPYGYIRDPLDKHHLIPDEAAKKNVQLIYDMRKMGISSRAIADHLNQGGELSPLEYYYRLQNKANHTHTKRAWGSASIQRILQHDVYIGHITQGKRRVKSFKDKTLTVTPPTEWITVKNMHEPIIDINTWEAVQNQLLLNKHNRRIHSSDTTSLFAGLCFCSDCGSKLVYSTKVNKQGKVYAFYKCAGYNNNGKSFCSSHMVRSDHLEDLVVSKLGEYINLSMDDEEYLV